MCVFLRKFDKPRKERGSQEGQEDDAGGYLKRRIERDRLRVMKAQDCEGKDWGKWKY